MVSVGMYTTLRTGASRIIKEGEGGRPSPPLLNILKLPTSTTLITNFGVVSDGRNIQLCFSFFFFLFYPFFF